MEEESSCSCVEVTAHLVLLVEVVIGVLTLANVKIFKPEDKHKIPTFQLDLVTWPGYGYLLLLIMDPDKESIWTVILKVVIVLLTLLVKAKKLHDHQMTTQMAVWMACVPVLVGIFMYYHDAAWTRHFGTCAHIILAMTIATSIKYYIDVAKKQRQRVSKNPIVLVVLTIFSFLMLYLNLEEGSIFGSILTVGEGIGCVVIWLLDFIVKLPPPPPEKEEKERNLDYLFEGADAPVQETTEEIRPVETVQAAAATVEAPIATIPAPPVESEPVVEHACPPPRHEEEAPIEVKKEEEKKEPEVAPKLPLEEEKAKVEEVQVLAKDLSEMIKESKDCTVKEEEIVLEPSGAASPSKSALPDKIVRLIKSNQGEFAKKFMKAEIGSDKQQTWRDAHFILALDCSGSMKGRRWKNLLSACKTFLNLLLPMPDTVVSLFSFDDVTYSLCKEVKPADALAKIDELKMGGRGTNFDKAILQIVKLINEASEKTQKYINSILFFSDGDGVLSDEAITELIALKEKKTILTFTITCENDEDEGLQKMALLMKGDHYKTTNSSALQQIFKKILTLT